MISIGRNLGLVFFSVKLRFPLVLSVVRLFHEGHQRSTKVALRQMNYAILMTCYFYFFAFVLYIRMREYR